MKGVVGMVICDHPGCHAAFMSPDLKTGRQDSEILSHETVIRALNEGWSMIHSGGEIFHYCPGHAK